MDVYGQLTCLLCMASFIASQLNMMRMFILFMIEYFTMRLRLYNRITCKPFYGMKFSNLKFWCRKLPNCPHLCSEICHPGQCPSSDRCLKKVDVWYFLFCTMPPKFMKLFFFVLPYLIFV